MPRFRDCYRCVRAGNLRASTIPRRSARLARHATICHADVADPRSGCPMSSCRVRPARGRRVPTGQLLPALDALLAVERRSPADRNRSCRRPLGAAARTRPRRRPASPRCVMRAADGRRSARRILARAPTPSASSSVDRNRLIVAARVADLTPEPKRAIWSPRCNASCSTPTVSTFVAPTPSRLVRAHGADDRPDDDAADAALNRSSKHHLPQRRRRARAGTA